jgi:hypothetical protein
MNTQTLPPQKPTPPEQRAVPGLLPEDVAYFSTISNSSLFSVEHAKQLFLNQPTEEQREELRVRLAHHRANPNELGITFAQLKAQLLTLPKQA